MERLRVLLRLGKQSISSQEAQGGSAIQIPLYSRPHAPILIVPSPSRTADAGMDDSPSHRLHVPTVPALPPSPWLWNVDADHTECMLCGQEFTLFMRAHHCRCCGMVVCNSCSGFYDPIVSKGLPASTHAFEAPIQVLREVAKEQLCLGSIPGRSCLLYTSDAADE